MISKFEISQIEALHQSAMNLADVALQALPQDRRGWFRDAFRLEAQAASITYKHKDYEPTRSVLHRSAASLAIDAGYTSDAKRLIWAALDGNPPKEIADELKSLWESKIAEPWKFDIGQLPDIVGEIDDVLIKSLQLRQDDRGWLIELFRQDEVPKDCWPVMTYVSQTLPGVTRGPHEHVHQTDGFAFVGPSNFRLFLWDTRIGSPTHGRNIVMEVGESNPTAIWVPPGVVHAYCNIGDVPGLVFNAPNKLYAGWGKKDKVDEIRHEDAEPGKFSMGGTCVTNT